MKRILPAIIALVLSVLPSTAAEPDAATLPQPQVTLDTNAIAVLVANWKNIATPGQFFGALKDSLEVQGVFAVGYGPANGLQSGFGASADITIWRVDLEAIYINLGPGYVLATAHDSQLIHGLEAGANIHFKQIQIEENLKAIPLIGMIPIAWNATKMHFGVGATIIGPASWQPIGIIATVGASVPFGK